MSAELVQHPARLFRRVDRGRVHWYEEAATGQHIDGVTTKLGAGFPKPGLINWAANATAQYAIDRWDWLGELPDQERLRVLQGARFNDSDEAKVKGTEVHRLAEQWAAGRDIEFPEGYSGYVDAYLRWRDEWQPADELIERSVVNWTYRYAGTLDSIATIAGRRTLVDIKTNRKGPYGDVALQLAAYGNAEWMLSEDGRAIEPMPRVDQYRVLWLHADGFDFYPVDVGEREWRVFLYVSEVGRWIDERSGWKAPNPALKGALLPASEVRP